MTIDDVLPHFGKNKIDLARFLNICKQAVYMWKGGVIPDRHRYKIISHITNLNGVQIIDRLTDNNVPRGTLK